MRHLDDDARRARLGVRHALAAPVADPLAAARAVTCLHATEPASVHLAAWARSGASLAEVDEALYDDRSLVKQLAMRRTVFAFPRELLPAVWGSAAARVAEQQVRQLAKEVHDTGIADDGRAWTERAPRPLAPPARRRGPATRPRSRERLPALDVRVTRGKGSYQAEVAISGRVIVTLAATGAIVRGANDGGWKLSRPRWTATSDWLGEVAGAAPRGPRVRRAGPAAWLAILRPRHRGRPGLVAGRHQGRRPAGAGRPRGGRGVARRWSTGWVLPGDDDPVADPGTWAALLPALDPTTMGWKDRGSHLGPHT